MPRTYNEVTSYSDLLTYLFSIGEGAGYAGGGDVALTLVGLRSIRCGMHGTYGFRFFEMEVGEYHSRLVRLVRRSCCKGVEQKPNVISCFLHS